MEVTYKVDDGFVGRGRSWTIDIDVLEADDNTEDAIKTFIYKECEEDRLDRHNIYIENMGDLVNQAQEEFKEDED